MWKNPKNIKNRKPNFNQLTAYGFVRQQDYYEYRTDILDGAFCVIVCIAEDETMHVQVVDNLTMEEYTLVYVADSVGAYVGTVRSASEAVINDIVDKCYESDIFKGDVTKKVISYVREKYGNTPEFLWEKSPNNAIFRESKTNKWYAALLTVEKRKIGIDEDGVVEIIDLKAAPDEIAEIVDGVNYLAGYHMNKKHWYTIRLDGSVAIEEIYDRIDTSYRTIEKKL